MEKHAPAELLKVFARDDSGAWTCLHFIELECPGGRIQVAAGSRFVPGTVFMGIDLAAWLDSKTRPPKLAAGK
jgi:hypothetical protein